MQIATAPPTSMEIWSLGIQLLNGMKLQVTAFVIAYINPGNKYEFQLMETTFLQVVNIGAGAYADGSGPKNSGHFQFVNGSGVQFTEWASGMFMFT